MTPQEVIKKLKNMYDSNNPFMHGRRIEIETAISALEKQIPQLVELTDDCCICPNCRFDMMGVYDFTSDDTKDPSYCPECGQALDWGDGE